MIMSRLEAGGPEEEASDLDAAAELDGAAGGQAEEVAGARRELAQHEEELALPVGQQRVVAAHDVVVADEVRGVHVIDRDALAREAGDVATDVGLLHEAVAQN